MLISRRCDITDVAWTMAAFVFIDHCRFITDVIFRMILAPRGNILLSPCVITHVLIVSEICQWYLYFPRNICMCSPTKFTYDQIGLLRVKWIELPNPSFDYEVQSRKYEYIFGLFIISSSSCQMLRSLISFGSEWILKYCNCDTVRMIPRAIARPLGPEATQYRNWESPAELSKPSFLLHTFTDLQVCYCLCVCVCVKKAVSTSSVLNLSHHLHICNC
jgi:hypothetical protein